VSEVSATQGFAPATNQLPWPADFRPSEPPTGTAVSRAFAVDWQIAQLFQKCAAVPGAGSRVCPPALPGLDKLRPGERTELGVAEVEVALGQLCGYLQPVRGEPMWTEGLRQSLRGGDPSATKGEIYRLHLKLLVTLTAADFRLGKAYGLGRALFDTCLAGASAAALADEFESGRIDKLHEWLADLRTAFPDHAAVAVSHTLSDWQRWVADIPDPANEDWSAGFGHTVHEALWRQGRLWRALLSGETRGIDRLTDRNYLSAANRMFGHARVLLWRLARSHVAAVLVVLALAGAAAIALSTSDNAGQTLAGLGALVAALGISWGGLGRGFFSILELVRAPLWRDALDAEIGAATRCVPETLRSAPERRGRIPLRHRRP
jgi:hypothetical protein